MQTLKFKRLWLVLGYAMVATVTFMSLIPSPLVVELKVSDKVMHTIGYFILMGWFVQIYQHKKQQALIAALFISMGVLLEFLQDMGGARHFEVMDMLANTLGVVIAWVLAVTPFTKSLCWFEKKVLKIV